MISGVVSNTLSASQEQTVVLLHFTKYSTGQPGLFRSRMMLSTERFGGATGWAAAVMAVEGALVVDVSISISPRSSAPSSTSSASASFSASESSSSETGWASHHSSVPPYASMNSSMVYAMPSEESTRFSARIWTRGEPSRATWSTHVAAQIITSPRASSSGT